MENRITRRLPLIAALLAATALAGCSGDPEEQPAAPANEPAENVVEVIDEAAPVEPIAPSESTPTPTPSPTPVVEEDRPSEEQVMDDADAVGMTARLPRENNGDEPAPAPVD